MKITIWHVKAEYAYISESPFYGHGVRTIQFLRTIANILSSMGHGVTLMKVRIAHPLKKTSLNHQIKSVKLKRTSILNRALVKSLKILVSLFPIEPVRRIVNFADLITVKCRIQDILKIMENNEDLNIIIFDDISSSYIFDDISRIHHEKNAILYLSHNFYLDSIPKTVRSAVESCETAMMKAADLVVVSGMRDRELYERRFKFVQDKIMAYVNIFPPIDPPYTPERLKGVLGSIKESKPGLVLTLGSKAAKERVKEYIKEVNEVIKTFTKLKIIIIGRHLTELAEKLDWGENEVELKDYIPSRAEFLRCLSKAHIGINYAYKPMGTNVKRFDFALAGLVILSRRFGARGELLPYEYTYWDSSDLKVKLERLLHMDLEEMGEENRCEALVLASKSYEELTEKLRNIIDNRFKH